MLYANSLSWLVCTHYYIISTPYIKSNMQTWWTGIDYTSPLPHCGHDRVTKLHPQSSSLRLSGSCYGRVRTGRLPRHTQTLAGCRKRWPRMSGLLLCSAHGHKIEQEASDTCNLSTNTCQPKAAVAILRRYKCKLVRKLQSLLPPLTNDVQAGVTGA